MSAETDKLSPEARSTWLRICQNAQLGRILSLYETPDVNPGEFSSANNILCSIASGLTPLIDGLDNTFSSQENLAFVPATNLFKINLNAFREKAPLTTSRADTDAAQAQRYFREAIDAIQPVVQMGEMRLWPDAMRRTPRWVSELPERKGPTA